MKLNLLSTLKFSLALFLGVFSTNASSQITITQQPMTQNVCEGDTLKLAVSVTSPGTPTYQWYKNGLLLGVTTADYLKVSTTPGDAGNYHVEIKEGVNVAISNTAVVTIATRPSISTQPNGTNRVCLGGTINLMGQATNVTGYVWKRDATTILVNNNNYIKTNANYSDEGYYYLIGKAFTGCPDIISDSIYVDIDTPVTIVSQPIGTALIPNIGLTHVMRVVATGKGPLAYQWFKDGAPIPGANTDSFKIYSYTTLNDSGVYTVQVSSSAPCNSSVMSNNAFVTSTQCPIILNQPDTLIDVCEGQPLTLEVEAVGAGGFQWAKQSVPLNGAIYSRYQVASATGDEEGYYLLHVLPMSGVTGCLQLTTHNIHVIVHKKPVFSLQPTMPASCEGLSHTITVNSSMTNSYNWYIDTTLQTGNNTNTFTVPVTSVVKTVRAEAISTFCPPEPSNSVLVRNVNPALMAHVYPDNRDNLVEQCTDVNGWTYYSDPTDMTKIIIGIRKNGNMVHFNPEVKTTAGTIYEVNPNNIIQKGALFGIRQFNVELDSGEEITMPYDVKFMYTAAEKTIFTDRINALKLRTGIGYNSEFPEKDLSFIVTTQDNMDTSVLSKFIVPYNYDNAIVSDFNYGRYNNVLFVEINKLVSKKGGGTFFFEYTDKNAVSIQGGVDQNVNIYPIPSSNELTVKADIGKYRNATLSINNMLGQEIFTTTIVDNNTKIDVSNFSIGNYILNIENDENVYQTKISIDR